LASFISVLTPTVKVGQMRILIPVISVEKLNESYTIDYTINDFVFPCLYEIIKGEYNGRNLSSY
jgi:hypothetical protein